MGHGVVGVVHHAGGLLLALAVALEERGLGRLPSVIANAWLSAVNVERLVDH